jgi:hypothetical protein
LAGKSPICQSKKEEVKLCLLVDKVIFYDVILCAENSKDSIKKLLELIN